MHTLQELKLKVRGRSPETPRIPDCDLGPSRRGAPWSSAVREGASASPPRSRALRKTRRSTDGSTSRGAPPGLRSSTSIRDTCTRTDRTPRAPRRRATWERAAPLRRSHAPCSRERRADRRPGTSPRRRTGRRRAPWPSTSRRAAEGAREGGIPDRAPGSAGVRGRCLHASVRRERRKRRRGSPRPPRRRRRMTRGSIPWTNRQREGIRHPPAEDYLHKST